MDIDATFVGAVGRRDNEVLKIVFFFVRFKVLTAVLMKIPVAGCILVHRYYHPVAYLGFCPLGQVVTIAAPKRNYGI